MHSSIADMTRCQSHTPPMDDIPSGICCMLTQTPVYRQEAQHGPSWPVDRRPQSCLPHAEALIGASSQRRRQRHAKHWRGWSDSTPPGMPGSHLTGARMEPWPEMLPAVGRTPSSRQTPGPHSTLSSTHTLRCTGAVHQSIPAVPEDAANMSHGTTASNFTMHLQYSEPDCQRRHCAPFPTLSAAVIRDSRQHASMSACHIDCAVVTVLTASCPPCRICTNVSFRLRPVKAPPATPPTAGKHSRSCDDRPHPASLTRHAE